MPSNNSVIKFVACSQASYTAATKDANTIYFTTDTNAIYVGSTEYTKRIQELTATPTSSTAGDDGRLYYYNGNLYMYKDSTWTKVANINEKNGTVTSVATGDGLTGGPVTSNGTISHAVPDGAAAITGSTTGQTPSFGGTFNIETVSTDKFGHVIAVNTRTVTIPSETALTVSTSSGTATTLTHGGTFTAVTAVAKGTGSHETKVTTQTFTLPADNDTTYTLATGSTDGTVKVTPSSGSAYEVTVKGWDTVAKLTDISAVLKFKGTVASKDKLPSSATTGDVYYVTEDSSEYVYLDSAWEELGPVIDLSSYALSSDVIQRVTGETGEVPKFNSDGTLSSTGFTLGKSVPADAVFTDTVYTHPTYTSYASGLYKVTVDTTGHVSAATAVAKSDITALGIPSEDTKVTSTVDSSSKIYLTGTTSSATSTAGLKHKTSVYADTDGSLTATSFHGNADTSTSATKATQDASGNVITETYATKDELTAAALTWTVM